MWWLPLLHQNIEPTCEVKEALFQNKCERIFFFAVMHLQDASVYNLNSLLRSTRHYCVDVLTPHWLTCGKHHQSSSSFFLFFIAACKIMKLSYKTCLQVAFAFFLGACFQLTNGKRELNEKRSIFASSKAVYIFH